MAGTRRIPVPAALVLDSSCWLEVFDGGKRAAWYEHAVAKPDQLIVPVITVYEVCKYLARVRSTDAANRAALYMCSGTVIDVDQDIAISAAGNGLPMADSLIYATAQARAAVVWTQDAHFDGLAGVHCFGKD